jgi:hypothetical protein
MPTHDDAAVAAGLFPSMRAAAPAPAPASPEADGEMAEALYGATTPTAAEAGLPVAGPDPWAEAERAAVQTAAGVALVPAEEVAAGLREVAPLFEEYGVRGDEAAVLARIGTAAILQPPDDARLGQWEADATDALRREFGAEAPRALADAQRLVASDRKLHDLLHSTGLGSHPQVVVQIAKVATARRKAG